MTKIKNQTNAFNTPIAEGVFNGVAWRSLTSKEEIRVPVIEKAWKSAKAWSELFEDDVLSHADVVHILYGMTVYDFINQPVDRIKLYQAKAKYNNNYLVK